MKNIRLKIWKWIRPFLKGFSLTSVAFVFQACYGAPESYYQLETVEISGTVTSKNTGQPIPGIKVEPAYWASFLTDENGDFHYYSTQDDQETLRFSDIDSTKNGSYLPLDTTFNTMNMTKVRLNISLQETSPR
ncbi:MAG: hypothetical protein LBR51_01965 [Bacteroidales bacterium]|jgi:hypothetical protein|nr:hypothetical protein [Bacteroidales bacterium]